MGIMTKDHLRAKVLYIVYLHRISAKVEISGYLNGEKHCYMEISPGEILRIFSYHEARNPDPDLIEIARIMGR